MASNLLPTSSDFVLSSPAPLVLVVTFNRAKKLNTLTGSMHQEGERIFKWFDENDDFLVAVVTGSGRAWSAGADLIDFQSHPLSTRASLPSQGFGGLSLRTGLKPVIAAVNGLTVGGSTEMLLGCDMVIASSLAILALPDVKVGLTGFGGTFPRLAARVGRGKASEMVFTGRNVTAEEAERWGLVDRIVQAERGESVESINQKVVADAVKIAVDICRNAPDAVIASREGLMRADTALIEEGRRFIQRWRHPMMERGNAKEGIEAFLERRKPTWRKGLKL